MRICCLIEPDYKRIIKGLFMCNGLIQGFTNPDEVALKLNEFLDQLPIIVSI